jgi:hypothetical protein
LAEILCLETSLFYDVGGEDLSEIIQFEEHRMGIIKWLFSVLNAPLFSEAVLFFFNA